MLEARAARLRRLCPRRLWTAHSAAGSGGGCARTRWYVPPMRCRQRTLGLLAATLAFLLPLLGGAGTGYAAGRSGTTGMGGGHTKARGHHTVIRPAEVALTQ